MQITIDTSKDSPNEIRKAIKKLQEIVGEGGGNDTVSQQANIFESASPAGDASGGMMNFFDMGQQAIPQSPESEGDSAEESNPSIQPEETITIAVAGEMPSDENSGESQDGDEIATGQDGAAQKILDSDAGSESQGAEKDILGNPLSKREKPQKPKKFKSGVITY